MSNLLSFMVILWAKETALVSLDNEQIDRLESKVEDEYSKSGLIRYAIKRLMEEPPKMEVEELETVRKCPTKHPTHPVLRSYMIICSLRE